jgi:O-acetyl-ADP-ribose deacetylase (regulator of RNase III)
MPRVYISSTFEDLKEHRQSVYQQLRRVGHHVIAMEDYVAQDQRPLPNCLEDVSRCDLYVGLFAWRYGYIPEIDNARRLSITELEYRCALDQGKECLVFLLDDDFAWPPPLQDSHTGAGEGGKLIKRLREELGKEKQVSFFKTADHLAALVGAAVEKWGQKVDSRTRDDASRRIIKELTSDEKIVIDRQIGRSRLLVINDDICNATTDIVVSSDDNYFTARGGVSKLLLDKLGPTVRRELEHYRNAGFRQGQVAITTGGNWGRRAVIHAAVIDLDYDLYPTPEAIQTLTRRSLECAIALGAGSIAFPVLGGGYATKRMSPSDCVNSMVTEMLAFTSAARRGQDQLLGIKLYIFNPKDNGGLPQTIWDPDGR